MSTTFTTTYDRSTRTWRTVTPAGQVIEHAHRAEVENQYLLAVAPTLAAQVAICAQRFPLLADRARRAGLLVAAQATRLPTEPRTLNEFMRVQGSGYQEAPSGRVIGRDWYSVTHSDRGYSCECVDFSDNSAPFVAALGGPICKHILAALLAFSTTIDKA